MDWRRALLSSVFLYLIHAECLVQATCNDVHTMESNKNCFGKGTTDKVTFKYHLNMENSDILLTLQCEATGYPRFVSIKYGDTKHFLASKTFSSRNYQPTMYLQTDVEMNYLCLDMKTYICEVTDFLGDNITRTLHVTHPACPPRLLDFTINNSMIYKNVNDATIFSFDVISFGDININVNSNRTTVNITRCESNTFSVRVLLNETQESDFMIYIIQVLLAENKSKSMKVYFTMTLKDRPQFCYDPNPNYTIYTRPSENLYVIFCLKSGVDIQYQHKMEVYVEKQSLSDKDIQVTKYNSRYQYGLDIVLHNQTFNSTSVIVIQLFDVLLKCRVNVVITAASCNNDNLKQPIPARLDQPLTIQFCVVSSSQLHDHIGINGHVIKVNTSYVTGLYRYVGVNRSGDDTYNVTIQLYPADVDGVQILQVLVKNVERETMPYKFQIKLLRENKTSIGPSYTSKNTTFSIKTSYTTIPSVTISSSLVLAVSTSANTKLSNNVQFFVPFISMAATTVILVIILVCVVTHYKQVNRCTSKFHRPSIQTDRYYMNVRFNPVDPCTNDAVTPVQDGESYRPSLTLELSSLHQYSELQNVHTFPHYSEARDTRGYQHWETHDRDNLTLYPQGGHYSLVEVRDLLAPGVSEANQSGGVIVEHLTPEQLQALNDGYITPIDHYSNIV